MLFWFLFPMLFRNEGNKQEINTWFEWVYKQSIVHDSSDIISFLTWHNKPINVDQMTTFTHWICFSLALFTYWQRHQNHYVAAGLRWRSPLARQSEGIATGTTPLFRQRITIDLIASKAVNSRGSRCSGQLCIMYTVQCLMVVVVVVYWPLGSKQISHSLCIQSHMSWRSRT